MPNEKNPHEGHRKRMIDKILKNGVSSLSDEELIEVLLYGSITRRDTGAIAHELIKTFGSLEGVLNASVDELCAVPNLGKMSAALITVLGKFLGKQKSMPLDREGQLLDTTHSMRIFCVELLQDSTVEEVHVIFLDKTMNVIETAPLAVGVFDATDLNIRGTVAKAMKNHCANVVIAHSHPGGIVLPSTRDVAATRRMANALRALGISLADHVIVNDEGDALSMRQNGFLKDIWNTPEE